MVVNGLLEPLAGKLARAVLRGRGSQQCAPATRRDVLPVSACGHRHRPKGRDWQCRKCGFSGHRDVVGAVNMHQNAFGVSVTFPAEVTYRRAGPMRAARGVNSPAPTPPARRSSPDPACGRGSPHHHRSCLGPPLHKAELQMREGKPDRRCVLRRCPPPPEKPRSPFRSRHGSVTLGKYDARAARDCLAAFIERWNGHLIVIDGSLCDELEFYPRLRITVEGALDRARAQNQISIRRPGEDPDRMHVITEIVRSLALPKDTIFEITGAWASRGEDGCVNSVQSALQEIGLPPSDRLRQRGLHRYAGR
jgi:hypothetical protein